MPATAKVNLTGNTDIDGILSGYKWADPNLTFSFPTALAQYGYSVSGFEAMNAAQQAAIRAVLKMYQQYTPLTFTEVTETSSTHGTLRYGEENNAGTAYAYYPSSAVQGGDVWLNHKDYNSPLKGGYAFATLMHETGHALGLDHGQDGLAILPTNHDSLEYSVMTYRSFPGANLTGYTVRDGSYPQSAMMDDIAALQSMYGANYNTNSGNTTYKWSPTTGEMSINGVGQGAGNANKIFLTIWDGGGNDTYDFSNYTTNLTVDLSPAGWTTTSTAQLADLGGGFYPNKFARGNIANAYLYNNNVASLIENAIGGTGNDSIKGNQVANRLDGGTGNDTLAGGLGNDTIIGGAGTDYCVIDVNRVNCVVTYDANTQTFTLTSSQGTDTATGVEYFTFSDGDVAASSLMGSPPPPPADTTAPTLTSTSPADDAAAVAVGANLTMTFSETVKAGAGNIVIRGPGGTVVATIAAGNTALVSFSGNTVTINPSADLAAGTAYYVTVDANAFTDIAGNAFAGITSSTAFNFATASPPPQDTTAPSLTSLSPADDATSVAVDANLVLAFNETIKAGAGNIVIHDAGGAVVATIAAGNTGLVTFSGSTVTINPTADLAAGSNYYVTIDANALTDSAGNAFAGISSPAAFNFGTVAAAPPPPPPPPPDDLTLAGTANGETLEGGNGNDSISGLGGNDTLRGGFGNDTLDGGAGDDQLWGGQGRDTLTGGAGRDSFYFDSTPGVTNLDTIRDFNPADDTLVLYRSFAGLSSGTLAADQFRVGTAAADANDHLIYNKTSGALYFDQDGTGSKAMVQIASLSPNLTLTASDFLIYT